MLEGSDLADLGYAAECSEVLEDSEGAGSLYCLDA